MLDVSSLTLSYGRGEPVLEGADLRVEPGQFVSLVGPSGSGKSSLLRAIIGLQQPSVGTVSLDVDRPDVGMLFQDDALLPWRTALDNVALGLRIRGKPRPSSRDEAERWLERLALAGFGQRFPRALSGGQRKRVALAQVLALEPRLLLMDEPFAALDQQTRELLQEEIRAIWRRTGKTVLWITHSIEEALFLATHVVVMTARPGRVKAAFACGFSREADPLIATTPEFAEAKRAIVGLLRQESLEAQRQETAA